MKTGVRGKVGLDVCVAVGGALDLVAGLVDSALHKGVLVVAEILLDGWTEEVEIRGVVAGARESFAGEVAGKDLFLEAVESVGDALEILEIGHCGGDGGVPIARGEDGIGCGCPVSARNVGSVSSVSFLARNLNR